MDTMAPIRSTLQSSRSLPLTAEPAAAAKARGYLRAALDAWDAPVDSDVAALLTSELVTNAVEHQAEGTIMVVVTCACGHLRVDVHDQSSSEPVLGAAPVDAEAGRGLMLVAGLSADWGYYETIVGKAVYFTLAFQVGPDEDDLRPHGRHRRCG